ncbi:hypothetical protein [Methylobacterium nigriterrae]|uniref:hypothetical protein n=1 Tax=Methylobacterium nigriterrae TaxID=3127512 RepID=UPI00301323AD
MAFNQNSNQGKQSEQSDKVADAAKAGVVLGMGHMIHHLAPEQVVRAVDRASERALAKAA